MKRWEITGDVYRRLFPLLTAGAMLGLAMLVWPQDAEGAIVAIMKGPGDLGTPVTRAAVQQGRTTDWYVNGHGVDLATSVSVSGTNVQVGIAARKRGYEHTFRGTPMGQLRLRFTTLAGAALGTRTVTIRYLAGQDQFSVLVLSNGTITGVAANPQPVVNVPSTLTVSGTQLNLSLDFAIPGCKVGGVGQPTATSRQLSVTCASSGTRTVRVRDAAALSLSSGVPIDEFYWTSSGTFAVQAGAPAPPPPPPAPPAGTPVLSGPTSWNTNLCAYPPNTPLSWSAVAGATSYNVLFSNLTANRTTTYNVKATTTTGPAPLIAGNSYQWQVQAVNAGGVGPLSGLRALSAIAGPGPAPGTTCTVGVLLSPF